MSAYECIFIVDSDLAEEKSAAVVARARELVANNGGSIVHEVAWGRRRLAYEMKGKQFGVYHVWYFNGNGDTLTELHRNLRYMDEVLKFQTLKVEDLEDEYKFFMKLQTEGSEFEKQRTVERNKREGGGRSSERDDDRADLATETA